MDLKDFISATLQQIHEGVMDAQDAGVHANPTRNVTGMDRNGTIIQDVEFDVVVQVVEGSGSSAGLKVGGWGVSVGGDTSSESSAATTNRIRFVVPLVLRASTNERRISV